MITNSRISFGDQLGAQMSTLANLVYLSEQNNQKIVFYDELKNFRRGLQFFDVFECKGIERLMAQNFLLKLAEGCIQRIDSSNWEKSMRATYFSGINYYRDRILYEFIKLFHMDFIQLHDLNGGVHCDKELVSLNGEKNYDIIDGYGTYQDWKVCEERIKREFVFKTEIKQKGDKLFDSLDLNDKKLVSVHFRLADYLVLSSLNLELDYYRNALKQYDVGNTYFLVFSDEIKKVKEMNIFKDINVIYMSGENDASIDMYLMTKCNEGNIIANSSFSFWGAYLNSSLHKKVVCPHDFVGTKEKNVNYINGNYYPDDWIAL